VTYGQEEERGKTKRQSGQGRKKRERKRERGKERAVKG